MSYPDWSLVYVIWSSTNDFFFWVYRVMISNVLSYKLIFIYRFVQVSKYFPFTKHWAEESLRPYVDLICGLAFKWLLDLIFWRVFFTRLIYYKLKPLLIRLLFVQNYLNFAVIFYRLFAHWYLLIILWFF